MNGSGDGPQRDGVKTRVVNISDDYDVYIGRPGHGEEGPFGNPVKRGPNDPPGATIPAFEVYFLRRIEEDPEFRNKVSALRGRRLGCFCPRNSPNCHGRVIVRWLHKDDPPEKGEQLRFF